MVDALALLRAAATATAAGKPAPSMQDFDDGVNEEGPTVDIDGKYYRYEEEILEIKGFTIHKIKVVDTDNKILDTKYYMDLNGDWCGLEEKCIGSDNKKYTITDETIEYDGHILHRIKMLDTYRDPRFSDIQGGWIESEDNLSQFGFCFVYDEAKVYGNAIVKGNASVSGNAIVCDNAIITGRAHVSEDAKVYGSAKVCGAASVCGYAKVLDNAKVSGWSRIRDDVVISGHAILIDHPTIVDNASVSGCSVIMGYPVIKEDTQVDGSVLISRSDSRDATATCEVMEYNIENLPPVDINSTEYCKPKTVLNKYEIPKCSKENKKYIFTGISKLYTTYKRTGGSYSSEAEEIRLFQIQRISDGMIGGWIQSEDNLSYEGDCWIGYRVNVFGNARVYSNAIVDGTGEIFGNAQVYGNVRIDNIFVIQDNAEIFDNVRTIGDELFMYDNAKIYGNTLIASSVAVRGNAKICGDSIFIDIEEEK